MIRGGVQRSLQVVLVAATWVLLALSFVHARYLQDQPLQHLPTVIGLVVLGRWARRGRVSNASMVSMLAFVWLHILGARYIYSFVPYDDWSRSLLGFSITEKFHFTRNHYDRLVHLAFGLLAIKPLIELLQRIGSLGSRWVDALSLGVVMGLSGLYEIVEWAVAMVMAPDWADRYNGQQGDPWDSQRDMACALVGAVLATAASLWIQRRRRRERAG
jgi:putative membrane protein